VYADQFEPEQAIRFSMADYREQEWMTNVPLYSVGAFCNENEQGRYFPAGYLKTT